MSVFTDGRCHLDSRQKMVLALEELAGEHAKPFRGSVSCWPIGDGSGPAMWRIELNDWGGNPPVIAELGDHLVLTYGRLLKLTDAEYRASQGA